MRAARPGGAPSSARATWPKEEDATPAPSSHPSISISHPLQDGQPGWPASVNGAPRQDTDLASAARSNRGYIHAALVPIDENDSRVRHEDARHLVPVDQRPAADHIAEFTPTGTAPASVSITFRSPSAAALGSDGVTVIGALARLRRRRDGIWCPSRSERKHPEARGRARGWLANRCSGLAPPPPAPSGPAPTPCGR